MVTGEEMYRNKASFECFHLYFVSNEAMTAYLQFNFVM